MEQAREKKVKKMNAYELLRENIMNFLHETLKKHLENMPSKWIWHDIFYFDDVNIIKKMLMGAPRNVVQLALKTPYHYLTVDIDTVFRVFELGIFQKLRGLDEVGGQKILFFVHV